MLENIGYKICSLFVDVYERKRISKRVHDSRAEPEQQVYMEHTKEEWFKNGIPVDSLPQGRIPLPQLGSSKRAENNYVLGERRVDRIQSGVDIVPKIKNIAFAAALASMPVAYLIGRMFISSQIL